MASSRSQNGQSRREPPDPQIKDAADQMIPYCKLSTLEDQDGYMNQGQIVSFLWGVADLLQEVAG
jgi:hypothetical protein